MIRRIVDPSAKIPNSVGLRSLASTMLLKEGNNEADHPHDATTANPAVARRLTSVAEGGSDGVSGPD